MGLPPYRARLMEKKTSEISLSLLQTVVAACRSRNSSRNRSRYHEGGDWRARPSSLCHRTRIESTVVAGMAASCLTDILTSQEVKSFRLDGGWKLLR